MRCGLSDKGMTVVKGLTCIVYVMMAVILALSGLTGCNNGSSESSGGWYGGDSGGTNPSTAALTSITLTPANPYLAAGAKLQMTATGTFSDNSTRDITAQVTFTSMKTEVATIDGGGLLTAVMEGITTIKALDPGTGKSAFADVSVGPAVIVSLAVQPVNEASYPFRIPLTTIDPSTGLPVPFTFSFKAWGTYSDGSTADVTNQVTWSTGNPAIMTISNVVATQGVGSAVSNGTTRLSAAYDGPPALTGSTMIKVVTPLPGTSIPKFAQPISMMPTAQPSTPGGTDYTLSMEQLSQQVLPPPLPQTTVWGFGPPGACTYPGPTFMAAQGAPITVTWLNNLPRTHILPIDYTLMGCTFGTPQNRAVVHLHGGNTPAAFDGTPEQWFTPGLAQTGPWFVTNTYTYPLDQEPTTLWYHDHAVGMTHLNTYAGLSGMFFIRGSSESALNLPSGPYEVGITIQDRFFYDDGSLSYPLTMIGGIQPSIEPENFGDTIVVNGKAWPYMNVEPRKYRLRILNSSGSRFYHLTFDNGGTPLSFKQIASDGGFLNAPVPLTGTVMGPAERCDMVVDFSGLTPGTTITMKNDAPTPFNPTDLIANPLPPTDPTTDVMQFRVVPLSSTDTSVVPADLRPGNHIVPFDTTNAQTRNLSLVEITDQFGRILPTLNGKSFMDPITEIVRNNTTEIWSVADITDDTHPIHIHLVQFQVLDRRPFDVAAYKSTGVLNFTGPPVPPPAQETGWKDTIQMNPGELTRLALKFKSYTGRYLWHCHIIEHEDHDMMRYYEVKP
jgi:spore coat protein A, manganese oxidase